MTDNMPMVLDVWTEVLLLIPMPDFAALYPKLGCRLFSLATDTGSVPAGQWHSLVQGTMPTSLDGHERFLGSTPDPAASGRAQNR